MSKVLLRIIRVEPVNKESEIVVKTNLAKKFIDEWGAKNRLTKLYYFLYKELPVVELPVEKETEDVDKQMASQRRVVVDFKAMMQNIEKNIGEIWDLLGQRIAERSHTAQLLVLHSNVYRFFSLVEAHNKQDHFSIPEFSSEYFDKIRYLPDEIGPILSLLLRSKKSGTKLSIKEFTDELIRLTYSSGKPVFKSVKILPDGYRFDSNNLMLALDTFIERLSQKISGKK